MLNSALSVFFWIKQMLFFHVYNVYLKLVGKVSIS